MKLEDFFKIKKKYKKYKKYFYFFYFKTSIEDFVTGVINFSEKIHLEYLENNLNKYLKKWTRPLENIID